jgi:Tetratricopeptide repeat.
MRSPEKAQTLALKALDLRLADRDDLGSWERLARFLALDGEPAQPNRTPLSTLGVAYYQLGKFSQAIETLEASLKARSEADSSAQTMLFLAMSQQRAGAPKKAQQYYIEALEAAATHPQLSRQERDEWEVFRREASSILGGRQN